MGLSSIAAYELIRSKGFPLPDTNNLLWMLIPVASFNDDNQVPDPGEPYDAGVEAYVREHGTTDGFVDSLPDDEHRTSFIQALLYWFSKHGSSQDEH